MKCSSRASLATSALVLLGSLSLFSPCAAARATSADRSSTAPPFAPFRDWSAAVVAGDKAALARLYSTNPPAIARVGETKAISLEQELGFWAGLKSAGVTAFNPKVLEITPLPGKARLLLRVEAVKPGAEPGVGETIVTSMVQFWAQQPDGWHIVATQRGEFSRAVARRLPQPVKPNAQLYSDPVDGPAELKAALAAGAREKKRVLVVFGANWCYDCHVLDATFHSKSFAPLVQANYVVVHINIGDEGKDNNDMAARLGVGLDRGIPSLAVLEPDGKVVVAQNNGEFQSTVKIGPEDVRSFLEKWKPAPTLRSRSRTQAKGESTAKYNP
jgi:thioredoxin 1